jgi:hypothetical protein
VNFSHGHGVGSNKGCEAVDAMKASTPRNPDKSRQPRQHGNRRDKHPAHHASHAETPLPSAFRIVSLKSVAELLDTTRSSARRWLREAGIKPIAVGRGAKGAIRYRWQDIEQYLNSRQYVE